MVNIQINDKISVISDANQYILREFKGLSEKDGTENYETIGYYSTLKSALKDYVEVTLRESNCTSIKQLIELHEQLEKKIDELIKF